MIRVTRLTMAALIVLAGGLAAAAPPAALKLKLIQLGQPRSHSPLTFDVDLRCDSPQLLEGELHLSVYAQKRLVHEYRSGELAVTAPGMRFRLLLPPVTADDDSTAQVLAYAKFVTSTQSIDLKDHDVI